MKKLVLLLSMSVALFASCSLGGGNDKDKLKAENDSLSLELSQRNAELDEIMGTFNDIQEGFRQINAAENRVDLQRNATAENATSVKEQIASDIQFITKTMEDNKAQIAKLQAQLKSSKTNSAQLKKAIETLNQREKQIILLRYYKNKTQSQVAQILGVSQVQISRLEKKILNNMKMVI